MQVTTPRTSVATRRVGYLAAALVDAVLLYLVDVSPGWQSVPFLTDDMSRVVGLVEVSLVVAVAANVLYAFVDAPWVRAAGGLATTAIGIAVLVQLWQVFPFDFGDASVDWALWTRVILAVGLAGSVIGLVVHATALIRSVHHVFVGGCDADSPSGRR